MSTTLPEGTVQPADGDTGVTFWDDLEALCDDVDDLKVVHTTAVAGSGWSASGDWYRKSVSMPAGMEFGETHIQCFLTTGTVPIYPLLEIITASSFYIYMPVNNLAITCLFKK